MPLPRRESDRTINPEIERLLYQEKVILQEAEGLYYGLNDIQANWRPGAQGWSIAQCFDHLNKINEGLIGKIETALSAAKAAGIRGDGPYVYGFFSRWMLRSLQPNGRKMKTSARFEPAEEKPLEGVLAAWKRTHERLEDLIRESNGLDLARIKVTSPVASLLEYPLGVAFWIQTAHDRRHLAQIRQLLAEPSFPK
jgi:hypothetical protein